MVIGTTGPGRKGIKMVLLPPSIQGLSARTSKPF